MIKKPLIFFCSLFSLSAFAGYADLSYPSSWKLLDGAAYYKAARNDASFANGVKSAVGAVANVGGRAVTMPVSYRYAANAMSYASRWAFANPLMMALTVGSIAYTYYQERNLEVLDGQWVVNTKKINVVVNNVSYPSPAAAAAAYWAAYNITNLVCIYVGPTSVECSAHIVSKEYGQTFNDRFGAEVFSSGSQRDAVIGDFPFADLPDIPSPDTSPQVVPEGFPQSFPAPLPVQDPIINPSPDHAPRPMTIPLSDPVLVPDSSPQQFKTPVIDIVSSPTLSNPWRVSTTPRDSISTDSAPLSDPSNNPTPDPTPGLCDLYPDIAACAKLDIIPDVDLVTKNKDITISELAGFGATNASCPAPRHLITLSYDFAYTPFCDFFAAIRPIILAFAWLAAAAILLGVRASGD